MNSIESTTVNSHQSAWLNRATTLELIEYGLWSGKFDHGIWSSKMSIAQTSNIITSGKRLKQFQCRRTYNWKLKNSILNWDL